MTRATAKTSITKPDDYSALFGSVDFPLKAHCSPHGRITAVSMMKDEGPFVLEWVAHHLSLGFTDLVVYTNDCSDGTDDMLLRLEALGLVHHRRNDIPDGLRPQPSALKYAQAEPVVCNSDWVLVFDADEFLCLKQGDGTLDGLLDAVVAQDANGIVITWRIFGSDGVEAWSRAPVTEQYLSAAPPMWNKGWGVKTLFKFDPDYWKLGIHRPKIKNKHLETDFPHSIKWLNGSGRPMEEYFKFRGWRSIVRTVGYDWAQMNHYAIKSKDSYALRKFRGNVNNKKDKYNAGYWSLQDRNEVHDDAALRHRDKRQDIFDTLMGDPVLSDLHMKAVAAVEARLDAFRETEDYAKLIADLRVASDVPITEVEAKPPKPRDPQKIAAQMSALEKKLTEGAASDRNADHQGPSAEAKPYVMGDIDFSQKLPIKAFANHEVHLPADPRVFSDAALQAITEGKFHRNHARRLPRIINAGDIFLEIGTGAGFLSAQLSKCVPNLQIIAQEETRTLLAVAHSVWKVNGVTLGETRKLCDTPLFDASDGQDKSSGLQTLMAQTECSVLYVNDPRITAPMIAHSITAAQITPRRVIIGPRALAGFCKAKEVAGVLTGLGYAPDMDAPLSEAVSMRLQRE